MIYTALLLIVIMGLILLLTLRTNEEGLPSSVYTYLTFKDGAYVGVEKTDQGNIKVEVTVNKERIKDIKLIEFPQKYMSENPTLKEEIGQLIYNITKAQATVPAESGRKTSFILNKINNAVRSAIDQSLIGQ